MQHACKIKGSFAELKTSLLVFGETFLTMASSNSQNFHDIDLNFYPGKNQKTKNESVSEILIKHFYSQVMNIFAEVLNRKLWGKYFFCNKIKTEPFLENCGHNVLDIEKNFIKTKFQKNFKLGHLQLLEVSRAL